jgi:hypothetical protein
MVELFMIYLSSSSHAMSWHEVALAINLDSEARLRYVIPKPQHLILRTMVL